MKPHQIQFEVEDLQKVSKEYFIPYLCRMLPADFILDVGCGLGQFLELCGRYNIGSVGIDGSDISVKECKRRGVTVILSNLEWPFPFKDETFDAISCNQVVEHIRFDKQDSLLEECYRVLKFGGKAFFYSPCKYNKEEICKAGHIACITPSVLRRKLTRAGFEVDLSLNYPRMVRGAPLIVLRILFIVAKSHRFPFRLGHSKLIDFLSASAHAVAYKNQ